MRNGNTAWTTGERSTWTVLTVPMRNGNWKIVERLYLRMLVLTVPMRNGNGDDYSSYRRPPKFLPYLWGMETSEGVGKLRGSVRSYRTYEEWKPGECPVFFSSSLKVLTVPMRNGNPFLGSFFAGDVPFLPYLWGMETPDIIKLRWLDLRSYRTYEEWKLCSQFVDFCE